MCGTLLLSTYGKFLMQMKLTGALLENCGAHELQESVGIESWPVDRYSVLRERQRD